MLLTDSQNLSMDEFASLGIAAAATSTLRLSTAVTNLTTRHPAVVASTFATLHHTTGSSTRRSPTCCRPTFCRDSVFSAPEECISRLTELLELGLSHLVLVGGSRDIDEKIRERSDHLLAAEVLPALRER